MNASKTNHNPAGCRDKWDKQGSVRGNSNKQNPAPAKHWVQDKELREFALWHFNKGRESLMKEVIEVLEEGKGYDAWGHDNISGEWDGLMKRLATLQEKQLGGTK
jgi:hypothetical protein